MTITLYINETEKNRIGKTLTSPLSLTGNLKEECSVINPVVILNGENLSGYNYMYIPEFSRYYFITNITCVSKDLWRIEGHVDVLESFKTELLLQNVIIEKQEISNQSNLDLDDGSFVVESGEFIETKMYPNGFNSNGEFILITAGAV